MGGNSTRRYRGSRWETLVRRSRVSKVGKGYTDNGGRQAGCKNRLEDRRDQRKILHTKEGCLAPPIPSGCVDHVCVENVHHECEDCVSDAPKGDRLISQTGRGGCGDDRVAYGACVEGQRR